jgi:inosine/xanthosine triphosphatase
MQVVVGSTNPIKVAAVEVSFLRQWPSAKVVGSAVETGVSEMPMSDEECVSGARNRARLALQQSDAEFGVGLEGGVNPEASGLMLLGWVAIVHRDGQESVGCTAKIPLPKLLAVRILAGEELGPVMDDVLGEKHTAQKGGASGALTNGLVMRQDKFAMAVAYALAPFVAPEFYQT